MTSKYIRLKASMLRATRSGTSSWEEHQFSRRWLLSFAIKMAEEVVALRKKVGHD